MRIFRAIGGGFVAALLMAAMPAPAQTGQTGQSGGAAMSDHDTMGHGAAGHAGKDHVAPPHGGGAGQPVADAADMRRCKGLPHADAMKDARCAALMRAHPDMMHHAPGHAM